MRTSSSAVATPLAADGAAQKLVLAVAGDAGDAEDLAAAHLERDVREMRCRADRRDGRLSASSTRRGSGATRVAAAAAFAAACARSSAPIIIAASDAAVSRRGSQVPTTLAAAQNRRGVAERPDLVELVADVEDRAALGGEPAQRREQLLGLLRREHRGRLVHDQQLRRLQQAAHDLDALPLADRQRPDIARWDRAAGRSARLTSRTRVASSRHRPGRVEAERDVLRHGHRLEQREMLEHHADAERAGGVRTCPAAIGSPFHASRRRRGAARP